jgi:hypothetical protein
MARDIGRSQREHLLRLTPVRGFVTEVIDRERLARVCGRRQLSVVGLADRDFIAGIDRLGIVGNGTDQTARRA